MQVYNFENLTKGDKVGDTARSDWCGETFYDEENKQFCHIEIGKLGIEYRTRCGSNYTDTEVKPEDFGCEAVCFCVGKDAFNPKRWEWWFVCTPEFLENNKEEILKHTVKRVNNF